MQTLQGIMIGQPLDFHAKVMDQVKWSMECLRSRPQFHGRILHPLYTATPQLIHGKKRAKFLASKLHAKLFASKVRAKSKLNHFPPMAQLLVRNTFHDFTLIISVSNLSQMSSDCQGIG